jgi:hypothetical protein
MFRSRDEMQAEPHWQLALDAASKAKAITEIYLRDFPEMKKSFFGKCYICQIQAKRIQNYTNQFLNKTRPDARLDYYFFIKNFIETYNNIPKNDPLFHALRDQVIPHLQHSLNTLLRLRTEDTSQEFMGPYVILVREKFGITMQEENPIPRSP